MTGWRLFLCRVLSALAAAAFATHWPLLLKSDRRFLSRRGGLFLRLAAASGSGGTARRVLLRAFRFARPQMNEQRQAGIGRHLADLRFEIAPVAVDQELLVVAEKDDLGN